MFFNHCRIPKRFQSLITKVGSIRMSHFCCIKRSIRLELSAAKYDINVYHVYFFHGYADDKLHSTGFYKKIRKKYTSGLRYWNVPVLVNSGTVLVYQYCLKMCYLRSLEDAGLIQELTILEHKIGLVLSNAHVPVSGTSSILFPKIFLGVSCVVHFTASE